MIWRLVWTLSEWSGVPLGRFAPFVFGKAIGASSWRKMK
jgi:hypothetical protein